MAEVLTLDLLREVFIKYGESDEVQSVVHVEGEPAVGEAENYCSNLYRTKVKVKLTSGKVITKTLVLKVFLKELEPSAYKEMKLFFANEATMYDKILINLADLGCKHSLQTPRLWPNCYFATTDIIIFDDLKEEGFIVPPRYNGLNLQEGHLVMKYLARLHALSYIGIKREIINPKLIRSVYTWANTDGWTAGYIKKAVKMVGQLATEWENQWKDVGERIKLYADTISEKLNRLFKEEVKMAVVNHGDCWINNIMIKYKDNSKTAECIKFVDFQNATYNSYGYDLIYFLYTSIQGELMLNNYDALLETYRNEFKEILLQLNEDSSLAPTIEEIKSEIVRLHPFCLAISCTVMAVNFSTANENIQIDDLTHNDDKLRKLYMNDVYTSSIKRHIKYYIEQKVI